jgi:hypothetical protein
MKHARKTALAASAFTCAALLSFGWSEQRGLSLSVEKAEARVGRPLTPVSVAGVARRHNRRAVGAGAVAVGMGRYGGGPNNAGGLVGGDDSGTYAGAAAVGTAGAVAATSPNWGWGGNPYQTGAGYYAGGPYYGGPVRGARAAYYGGGPNNRGGLVGGDDSGTYAGGPYYGGPVRGARAAYGGYAGVGASPGVWTGGVSSSDYALYIRNLHDSGYDRKNNFNASGNVAQN